MSNIQKSNVHEISDYFAKDVVKSKLAEILKERTPQFITSVLQIVNSNGMLAEADKKTVYTAAITAATLNLPLNNNLGFAYIVPYRTKQKDGTFKMIAQFQMGYKGFIQLALRSGQFEDLSSAPVYEGQLIEENPLEGHRFDWSKKTSDVIIGYVAYFKLLNGFKKYLYMTVSEVQEHGNKYSKTYSQQYGQWQTNFQGMATKTVLKLLLSKFAPLSVELQRAVIADQAVVTEVDDETMEVQYIDNEDMETSVTTDRAEVMINDCTTVDELNALKEELPPFYGDLFDAREAQLTKKGK
jgi:recombination protein RecT